jgi:hypothetical protein
MVKEQVSETTNGIGWAQDSCINEGRRRALEQQFGHLQSMVTQRWMRGVEASLRCAGRGAASPACKKS